MYSLYDMSLTETHCSVESGESMLGLGLVACCKWGLCQPSTLPDIGDWVGFRCTVLVVQRLRVNGYLFLGGSANLQGRGQAWTPWCELNCMFIMVMHT